MASAISLPRPQEPDAVALGCRERTTGRYPRVAFLGSASGVYGFMGENPVALGGVSGPRGERGRARGPGVTSGKSGRGRKSTWGCLSLERVRGEVSFSLARHRRRSRKVDVGLLEAAFD